MTIRSNPAGALVYIDDVEIGMTPASVNYLHYGTRKIRLVKDGYETQTVYEKIPAPWYDAFPIDLVTENFTPGELRDRREFVYQLQPLRDVPRDTLLDRAEHLRQSSRPAPAVPMTTTPPVVPNVGAGTLIPPTSLEAAPTRLPAVDGGPALLPPTFPPPP